MKSVNIIYVSCLNIDYLGVCVCEFIYDTTIVVYLLSVDSIIHRKQQYIYMNLNPDNDTVNGCLHLDRM